MPQRTTKCIWVALLLLVLSACSGAEKRDPYAVAKAQQALEQGNVEVARVHAENAVKFTPDDADSRRVMAQVHRALAERASDRGDFGRASDAFTRAAQYEPRRADRAADFLAAFSHGRDAGRPAAQLSELMVGAVEAQPADLEVRMEAATAFDELGDAVRAVESYLFVYEADRTNVALGMRLGLLYLALDRTSDAEAIFRRVLEQDEGNVQANLQLAEIYESGSYVSRARSIYAMLAKLYPTNGALLLRYAEFLERTGDTREAARVRDKAYDNLPGVERRRMRTLKSRKKR